MLQNTDCHKTKVKRTLDIVRIYTNHGINIHLSRETTITRIITSDKMHKSENRSSLHSFLCICFADITIKTTRYCNDFIQDVNRLCFQNNKKA